MARNPFRSEAEAYRFVMLLAGYFAVIVATKVLLGTWPALIATAVLSVVVLWWIFRTGPREGPERIAPVHRGGPRDRRILVVANETVGGERLRRCIREKGEGFDTQVLVVTPALNSPLRHWASDDDGARAAARERLEHSLSRLRAAGVEAAGELGASEPVQAIEDALRTFGADEIIISTHPEGRSNWLERGGCRWLFSQAGPGSCGAAPSPGDASSDSSTSSRVRRRRSLPTRISPSGFGARKPGHRASPSHAR